jgi:sigma-B regulation protein RsbU (phosphoserine phosphatase)
MTPTKLRERIFPTAHPVIAGLDYFGDWRPARGKGADYIDYFKMKDGNLGLAVGDVRGKGVPPALLKTSLHSMIRALRVARSFSLKALMRTIDKIFSEVCPDNSYATRGTNRRSCCAGTAAISRPSFWNRAVR